MAPSPTPSSASKRGMYARCAWRALAFIALVIILVYYVPVIASESVDKISLSPQWVYVLVVVGLSALTVVLDFFLVPHMLFAAHWIITVLWLAAFGVFAKLFLSRSNKRHDEFEFTDAKKLHQKHVDTAKMKVGVWILFVVTLMWALYAAYTTWSFVKGKKAAKRATDENGTWYRMNESQVAD